MLLLNISSNLVLRTTCTCPLSSFLSLGIQTGQGEDALCLLLTSEVLAGSCVGWGIGLQPSEDPPLAGADLAGAFSRNTCMPLFLCPDRISEFQG